MNEFFNDRVEKKLEELELKCLAAPNDTENFLNKMYSIILEHFNSDNLPK